MIENFIATGCSFTSGIFDFDHNLDNAQTSWEQKSFSWPHFVFSDMSFIGKNFYNFAIAGAGNLAAMTNLTLFLEKNPHINKENSLVGINFTELGRLDCITDKDDPESNQDSSTKHTKKFLNVGWITKGILAYKLNLELQIATHIIQTLIYLETKKINYFFMLMKDQIYSEGPLFFKDFLDCRQEKWVTFEKHKGMENFVIDKNLTISYHDTHPTKLGHRVIADYVVKHLNQTL